MSITVHSTDTIALIVGSTRVGVAHRRLPADRDEVIHSLLVNRHPNFVCRVTADEGAIGLIHLARFRNVNKLAPVISQIIAVLLPATLKRVFAESA